MTTRSKGSIEFNGGFLLLVALIVGFWVYYHLAELSIARESLAIERQRLELEQQKVVGK